VHGDLRARVRLPRDRRLAGRGRCSRRGGGRREYDGTDTFPVGLEDVTGYPRLVAALLEHSWSDAEVAKLVRGNTLRVMRDVEAVARDLQTTRAPSLRTFAELDGAR
jgi:membrane dipeptidase